MKSERKTHTQNNGVVIKSKTGVTPGGRSYKTTRISAPGQGTSKHTALFPKNSTFPTFMKDTGWDGVGPVKRAGRKPIKTRESISSRKIDKGPTKPLRKKK